MAEVVLCMFEWWRAWGRSRCVRHVEVVLRMLGVLEAMRRVQEEKRAYENQAPNFMALKILLEYKVGDASASLDGA